MDDGGTVKYRGGGSRPETRKILSLGNSIMLHPTCDYWCGMAASDKGMNYVHQIVSMLATEYNVEWVSANFYIWETQNTIEQSHIQ